jgi:hypothetical protein
LTRIESASKAKSRALFIRPIPFAAQSHRTHNPRYRLCPEIEAEQFVKSSPFTDSSTLKKLAPISHSEEEAPENHLEKFGKRNFTKPVTQTIGEFHRSVLNQII